MTIYAFRLRRLHTIEPRSRVTDDDVVTFGVTVNEQDRGQCAGRTPGFRGADLDMALVPATTGTGDWYRDFTVGPFDIGPDDTIRVYYSVTNVGDTQLPDAEMEKYQLRIMDAMLSAAVGALAGAVGAVSGVVGTLLGKVLGLVPSPVETILGWKPDGPCNGIVAAGVVDLTASGISALEYHDSPSLRPSGPACRAASITRHYDDQSTHSTERCGDVAQTDLTFEVLQVTPGVSVRHYAARRGVDGAGIAVRRMRPGGGPTSVRELVGLLP